MKISLEVRKVGTLPDVVSVINRAGLLGGHEFFKQAERLVVLLRFLSQLVPETLFLICFVVLGICGTFEGGLQFEQQCPYWLAGYCRGHCYRHRHQPGDAEEEAVRHYQPWDCGGEAVSLS